MTYYVQKQLALGPIRFGVSIRKDAETLDRDPTLNTGPNGEFVRRREDGFFLGDTTVVAEPAIPLTPTIARTPFLVSLKPDGTRRGYLLLALIAVGFLFILLGLAVVARKGPQGWVEVILGIALIAIPILLTAQRRKQIEEQEEFDRTEREELERRNRELLTWYMKALNYLKIERSETAMAALRGERETLTVPYELWGPQARRIVLEIGFEELAARGVQAAKPIADVLRRTADAAGLTAEDIAGVVHDLYATVFWHLLADDRLSTENEQRLDALRDGLGVSEADARIDLLSAAQLRDLRGITTANLPRAQCAIPLAFQEYCIHQAPLEHGTLFITNRRLILDETKRMEVPLPKVFDVAIDVDNSTVAVKTGEKKPRQLRLGYPIFTGALIDLAANLDERPHGFA